VHLAARCSRRPRNEGRAEPGNTWPTRSGSRWRSTTRNEGLGRTAPDRPDTS
jgi:hypothetical protein